MSLDPAALAEAVARHGPVHRVVVAETRGSAPREPGAAMLVWAEGQSGTIGGGTLEHAALAAARAGRTGPSRHALGPEMGQCCGGAVTLWTETWDAAAIAALTGPVHARGPGPRPARVADMLARAAEGHPVALPTLVDGWFVEAVAPARRPVWIWGAGHVGRALVATLSPLPELAITWIDDAADRFPTDIPGAVSPLVSAEMPRAAAHAPPEAHHVVLTYSHEIDLALCHALLSRPTASIGLIGSATKWARFRSRLRALGHSDAAISRILCPIGDPALGKHPHAIAIGVAARLLGDRAGSSERKAG